MFLDSENISRDSKNVYEVKTICSWIQKNGHSYYERCSCLIKKLGGIKCSCIQKNIHGLRDICKTMSM
jgi:hypothetical protein